MQIVFELKVTKDFKHYIKLQITTQVCTVSSLCKRDAGDVYGDSMHARCATVDLLYYSQQNLLADTSCQH